MSTPMAAEVFPLGEHLADELDARGWTQADFAEVLGRPAQFVSEVISGKKEITRESAAQIATALGTSAELWLKLQDSYLLWKQSQDSRTRENLDAVKTRARLRALAPVALLRKRGFITMADPEGQSNEVLRLFGMQSLDEEPTVRFAARRSNPDEAVTVLQRAWVACVKASARELEVAPYSRERLRRLAEQLSERARNPEAFADFQASFMEVGVKLIYVEAFPGGKLDGCALIVDETPVIGISGRWKRLDKVLFTILHETAHVLLGHVSEDGGVIIDDLSEESQDEEMEADQLASELTISRPLPVVPERPSMTWAQTQAEALGVHPITLIGRLQNDGLLSWKTTLVRNAPNVTDQLKRWKTLAPA
ncbi:helix-turn-helix domain-containing protein [Corynebacterium silvaticum]|uniref:Helix-turn-helix domain-containing protein n=1 Tax=Corynebacterium silvaticum TaxID=2320431 RepID=A0A7Y4LIS5_9CORY|nr:helix-turn-helix domain-containing protein [Corynebacterium silvaticum]ARU47031.1 helix-turn-helix domain-containing protein [Corynebacterium silvaticum]MBH5301005.1 helix-turn-helix domain-containing protein [Corynebacterium silvaticum]NOM65206.1 helix-turn-helix domain-containing protein [Corynebacterium silvaticum]NON70841.1 helix-turn-helix domain-containing protein [Corynebacterium silvaticum]TFA92781.1 helix-turn-helix domain-containing protein [Corynebacterium silvaticum]